MKIDTSLTHLDAMIRQGYRTRKTLVWGVPVSQSTLQHELTEQIRHSRLIPDIRWYFRATAMIKKAHTPRKPGEDITALNWDAVY